MNQANLKIILPIFENSIRGVIIKNFTEHNFFKAQKYISFEIST